MERSEIRGRWRHASAQSRIAPRSEPESLSRDGLSHKGGYAHLRRAMAKPIGGGAADDARDGFREGLNSSYGLWRPSLRRGPTLDTLTRRPHGRLGITGRGRRHDLEILHRAAGPRQRAGDPHG